MAAALMLSHADFDVHLFEKRHQLGGGLIASATPPLKDKLFWYLDYLQHQIDKSTVKVHLDTDVDAATLQSVGPDVVVLATGAVPIDLGIAGAGADVVQAYDLLMDGQPADAGNLANSKTIVYGGGETGCETAELLAHAGSEVTLVTRSPSDQLARSAELLYRRQLVPRLNSNPKITILDNSQISRVRGKTAFIRKTVKGDLQVQFDTLLIAQGRKAGSAMKAELDAAGIPCVEIGDAAEVRRIGDAVHDAYNFVMRYAEETRIGAIAS
jgi:pyruvate/2-oxoglutarate dehydrogenase complex dihydrolipoamide dehydrogenase (E3) component